MNSKVIRTVLIILVLASIGYWYLNTQSPQSATQTTSQQQGVQGGGGYPTVDSQGQ